MYLEIFTAAREKLCCIFPEEKSVLMLDVSTLASTCSFSHFIFQFVYHLTSCHASLNSFLSSLSLLLLVLLLFFIACCLIPIPSCCLSLSLSHTHTQVGLSRENTCLYSILICFERSAWVFMDVSTVSFTKAFLSPKCFFNVLQ